MVPEKLTTQRLNIHYDRVRDDTTVRLEGRRKKEREKRKDKQITVVYRTLYFYYFSFVKLFYQTRTK